MAYVPPALRKKNDRQDPHDDSHVQSPSDATTLLRTSPTAESAPKRQFSYLAIHNHYWPDHNSSSAVVIKQQQQQQQQQPGSFATDGFHHSTLNGSAQVPNQLQYIILFHDANPRWKSDGIIFVKSSLHLLPGSEKFAHKTGRKVDGPHGEPAASSSSSSSSSSTNAQDRISSTPNDDDDDDKNSPTATEQQQQQQQDKTVTAPSNMNTTTTTTTPDLALYHDCSGPIAVFEQQDGRQGLFAFAGYHRLARLQFLAPGSDDLQRMLQQKFSTVGRDGTVVARQRSRNAWEASMRHRWAVVKLERMDEAEDEAEAAAQAAAAAAAAGSLITTTTTTEPPDIQVGDLGEFNKKNKNNNKKGVNELLREMRIRDEVVPGAEGGELVG